MAKRKKKQIDEQELARIKFMQDRLTSAAGACLAEQKSPISKVAALAALRRDLDLDEEKASRLLEGLITYGIAAKTPKGLQMDASKLSLKKGVVGFSKTGRLYLDPLDGSERIDLHFNDEPEEITCLPGDTDWCAPEYFEAHVCL